MGLPRGMRVRGDTYYFESRGPWGRVSKSLGTKDMATALSRYAEVRSLVEGGRARAVNDWTPEGGLTYESGPILLDEELGSWVELMSTQVEESSSRRYRVVADALLADFSGREMRTITSREASEWLSKPRDKPGRPQEPWAPATRLTAARILRGFWAHVIGHEAEMAEIQVREPRLTRNPWDGVKVAEGKVARREYLPRWKFPLLMEAVEGTPQEAFLAVAFLAGLRQQEICHLRREDVTGSVIRVRPREEPVRWRPKSKRSIREVEIGPYLAYAIERHIEAGFAGERYLFTTDGVSPLGAKTAAHWTRASFNAAGIRYGSNVEGGLTLHSARRSYASWLVSDGVSLQIVAALLGNSVQVCEHHYAHLVPDAVRHAAVRMEASITGEER